MTENEFHPFEDISDIFSGTRAWYPVERHDLPMWVDNRLTRCGAAIALWLNDKPARHECIEIDHEITHRFFFKKKTDLEEFNKFLSALEPDSSIEPFETIEEALAQVSGNTLDLTAVVKFTVEDEFSEDSYNMWCWCKDHLTSRVINGNGFLLFEDVGDATLFKLKYLNTEA